MRPRPVTVLASLLALLFLVPAALAGGWVVVTLDTLPSEIRQGEPVQLGFTVRQHGQTPTNDVQPYLEARHPETGETLHIKARQQGPVGHFVLELTFPSAGPWEWSVHPEPFAATQLPSVTVLPVATGSTRVPASTVEVGPARSALRWAGVALLVAAVAVYGVRGARLAAQARGQPVAGTSTET